MFVDSKDSRFALVVLVGMLASIKFKMGINMVHVVGLPCSYTRVALGSRLVGG